MVVTMIGGRVFGIFAIALILTGCSTYGSTFGCGDAPGAKCMPMDKVDRLIASGEIETYTKEQRCNGARCKRSRRFKESELPAVQQGTRDNEIEFID